MLRKLSCLFILTVFFFNASVSAQGHNDFWVMPGIDAWNIAHKVSKGETVFMLARRYHVPPAILADANGLTYNDGLKENSTVLVPLGAYNLQTAKPANPSDVRGLYYKVQPQDNLYRISRHTSASQKMLAQWNNMDGRDVKPGQTILVGWVLYDATVINNVPATGTVIAKPAPPVEKPARITVKQQDTPKYVLQAPQTINTPSTPPPPPPATDITALPQMDTDIADTPPVPATLEGLYQEQTQNGANVVTEKGTAAFYTLTSNAKGTAALAFHNKAAKGAVIKVKNLNNGRYVYVKVLGPVPTTKQYNNCIIGLSDKVQAVLGVKDTRAFCELSYGGY